MKRLMVLPLMLATLQLSGCAVIAAVSALPGFVVSSVGSQVGSDVQSFPRNIEPTAAAVQKSLRDMMLYANVVEIRNKGYDIAFGDGDLTGVISLEQRTPRLTTVHVRVRGIMRDISVERAVIDAVRDNLARMDSEQRLSLQGYGKLRSRPKARGTLLGWYRLNANIGADRLGNSGWSRLTLPSGRNAFFENQPPGGSVN